MKNLNKETISTCSLPIFQRLMINFLLLQKAHEAKIEYLKCVKVPDLHSRFMDLDRQEVIKRKQVLFRRKQLAINSRPARLVGMPLKQSSEEIQSHYFSHLKVKKPKQFPSSEASIQQKKKPYNFTATPI